MTVNTMKLFDLSYIRELSDGDQDFFFSMLDIFRKYTPEAIEEMKTSFNSRDYDRLRKVAHRIKPSIYSLKIDPVSEEIKSLSLLNKQEMTDNEIRRAIIKLETVINNVIIELRDAQF